MHSFLICLFLLLAGTHNVFAAEINSINMQEHQNLCHQCQSHSERLKICGKCKKARYCGKKCQTDAWPLHKLTCKKPTVAIPAAARVQDFWLRNGAIDPELEIILSKFKALRTPVSVQDQTSHELIARILDEYLTMRGDRPKILIVGCGKSPYAWTGDHNRVGANSWRDHGVDGDHTHQDALTIAETKNVEPNIVWDFLLELPVALHGKFDEVYFEKLPPRVLAQKQLYQNAYAALKQDGLLVVDFQLITAYEAGYSEIIHASPFERICPSMYKGNLPDFLHNSSIEKRFALFSDALLTLGFTGATYRVVENNKYNKRPIQSQVFVTKTR